MGVQKSPKGIEYINVQIIDPAPQGWLGHKPVYKELAEGEEAPNEDREIDFEKTPVISMTRLQAEKLIGRGQATESKRKPKVKRGRSPVNKKAPVPKNK